MADKKVEETSLAGRAWNATKSDNDPDWASIPNTEFKGKLEHAAERAKVTGSALTNFDRAVLEFAKEDAKVEDAPMAVVDPNPEVSATAPTAVATKAPAKVKAAAKKSGAKKKAAAKTAAKTDKSGHVPTAKEVAAAVKAEKTAPIHP